MRLFQLSKATVAVDVLAAAGTLAGCATVGGSSASGGAGSGSLAEQAPLADVTQADYERAYTDFSQCMSDRGASLVGESMEGPVHRYSFPGGGEKAFDECYADFAAVDIQWQMQNEYDLATIVHFRECLEAIGVEPEKTAEGVWRQIQEHGVDPTACTLGDASD